MDASTQYGRTAPNPAYDLYERHHLAAVQPALGPSGCSADLASISEAVNAACCGEAGCENNAPQTCSAECSGLWMPFGIPTPLSPLFLGRFSPVLRRFSAVILCCLASWRQDGENGRKMA